MVGLTSSMLLSISKKKFLINQARKSMEIMKETFIRPIDSLMPSSVQSSSTSFTLRKSQFFMLWSSLGSSLKFLSFSISFWSLKRRNFASFIRFVSHQASFLSISSLNFLIYYSSLSSNSIFFSIYSFWKSRSLISYKVPWYFAKLLLDRNLHLLNQE